MSQNQVTRIDTDRFTSVVSPLVYAKFKEWVETLPTSIFDIINTKKVGFISSYSKKHDCVYVYYYDGKKYDKYGKVSIGKVTSMYILMIELVNTETVTLYKGFYHFIDDNGFFKMLNNNIGTIFTLEDDYDYKG